MTRSEIQKEHIKMLEWAISFCQQPLDKVTEGGWIDLNNDLSYFIFRSSGSGEAGGARLLGSARMVNLKPPKKGIHRLKNPTQKEIAEVQKELLVDLKSLAFDPKSADDMGLLTPPIEEAKVAVQQVRPDYPFMYALDIGEDLKAKARAALFEYLVGSGILAGQLRICPNPDCKRIFLSRMKPRTDRKFHCSARCARLAATRRYRQKKSAELRPKERERSHRRYVEKQQRELGSKVKVQRRPREG